MTGFVPSPPGPREPNCPHCQRPLPGDARTCPHCGIDLALVALLAERTYLEGLPEAAPLAATPEALVPRIGEYLIEQGLLAPEQLDKALARQGELARQGARRLLGQTLLEMGLVDRETLDRAITRQIIELHAALQEANRTLERRVAERTIELRRALERLTELNQLKANLISNVSHELRTPLAHVRGYVDLLAAASLGPLTASQEEALGVVQRAIERLERLIEDLIEFSSAAREGVVLRPTEVDVGSLFEGVIERAAEKARRAGVRLEHTLAPGVHAVRADADRIAWAVFQLVDNGIKFTPSGGVVTLGAEAQPQAVAVWVHDTGIGIPAERQAELFEPFHQLDGSMTRRYSGTGLGLALVRLILEAHGAVIRVESAEGAGSTFRFALPAAATA